MGADAGGASTFGANLRFLLGGSILFFFPSLLFFASLKMKRMRPRRKGPPGVSRLGRRHKNFGYAEAVRRSKYQQGVWVVSSREKNETGGH